MSFFSTGSQFDLFELWLIIDSHIVIIGSYSFSIVHGWHFIQIKTFQQSHIETFLTHGEKLYKCYLFDLILT